MPGALTTSRTRRRTSADAIPRPILVQPELSPQINSSDLVVCRQAGRRPALEDDAFVDDVRTVGDSQRLTHVVIRDEDANPTVLQVEDDFLNVGDRNRVDAGERLVEQDELG